MTIAEWNIGQFRITSFGNGQSYRIADEISDIFLQGDDALTWRAEYDAADDNDTVEAFLADTMSNYG